MPAPDDFQSLARRFTDPVQHDYEVIRGVMLADETLAERSRITGVDRGTVGEKAKRFLQDGMFGLVDRRVTKAGHHAFPDVVAGYILYVKQLYPPIHYREIARIVQRKYGFKTNHHAITRFLKQHPLPVQLPLPVTRYHQFEDAYQARWTVVRMYYEGWHQQSIAGCLGLSRQHVWNILQAFARDDFAGLEDHRSRPASHPANQLSLPFLKAVRDVQREYPRAGRFRVHGLVEQRLEEAPSERTVGRAMAINRTHHDAPDPWVSDRPPDAEDGIIKFLPYRPTRRHRFWFIDIRYLVHIGEDKHWTYSICILEGYSRKILVGMAAEYQDIIVVLQLLVAALTEYGCPDGVVSDNGSVFTSDAYEGLLQALDIRVCHIEKGKPWQNLLESQFKIQLRLADAHFEQAQTLEEIQKRHAAFIDTFNTTPHWAHQQREDGLRTPVTVLGKERGRDIEAGAVHRAVRELQVERTIDRIGYVSIQRFYIYAERGLARTRVSIWLYDNHLQIAHQQTVLARYRYRADRRATRLRTVNRPRIYHTPYASPQLEFWEMDDAQWSKVLQLPPYAPRHRTGGDAIQAHFAI